MREGGCFGWRLSGGGTDEKARVYESCLVYCVPCVCGTQMIWLALRIASRVQ